jgi:RNA polymerase sigma-70 factor, ECF subfamily
MGFPGLHISLAKRSDEELMELVGRGGHAALDELYARYGARLLAYFARMLDRDDALAQDFLQDLFLKIIERPELFDAARSFRTWLYSIAHNMCRNEYRRRGVRLHEPADADTFAADGALHDVAVDMAQFARVLDSELALLDAEQRTTFLLRHQEELSIREIATIVEVPEGTVKSRLFNTTRRLARRLDAYRPGAEPGGGPDTTIEAGRYA